MSAHLERFLDRLEGVHKYSRGGYRAKCPVGHSRKDGSLTINEGDNGSVILHCFAGCTVHEITGAVGMQVKDLFPPQPTRNMTRAERLELRESVQQTKWREASVVLGLESEVVLAAAKKIHAGSALDKADRERLKKAIQKIAEVRQVMAVKLPR